MTSRLLERSRQGNNGKLRIGLFLGLLNAVTIAQPLLAQNPSSFPEFYEDPVALSSADIRFPQLLTIGDNLVVVYQAITAQNENGGTTAVEAKISPGGRGFGTAVTLASNLPFVGPAPPIVFSAAVSSPNKLLLAFSKDAQTIEVQEFILTGGAFAIEHEASSLESDTTLVFPRLYTRSNGSASLFVTQSTGTSLNIQYASSPNGVDWTDFLPLEPNMTTSVNLNPSMASIGNGDIVVFQSLDFQTLNAAGGSFYQLYIKQSADNGKTWSPARLLTDFISPGDSVDQRGAVIYDNQRPHLRAIGNTYHLVWERALRRGTAQVWYLRLDNLAGRIGNPAQVSVSPTGGFGPVVFLAGNQVRVMWFSSPQRGSKVMMSSLTQETRWTATEVSPDGGTALYPTAAVLSGKTHMAYQYRPDNAVDQSRLMYVEPDQRAAIPVIAGDNFSNGQRSNRNILQVRFIPQQDASGIAGFSFSYGTDPNLTVETSLMVRTGEPPRSLPLSNDGTWYIRARSLDNAGNWSEPAMITYVLDRTPPDAVQFESIDRDEEGYLVSNTFSVTWSKPPQDDFSEYMWSLQYLGDIPHDSPVLATVASRDIPAMGSQDRAFLSRINVENGVYYLSVWAVDGVGNRSEARGTFLFTNKYIPSTIIGFVDRQQDILGNSYISIQGRGFTANGTITRVVLDKDGLGPFDYEFSLAENDYVVAGDRSIRDLNIGNLKTDSYLIGLEHSERGFEFSGRRLFVEERGVIKFGDFTIDQPPAYRVVPVTAIRLDSGNLLLILVVVLLLAAGIFSILQLRTVVKESQMLALTARALVLGRTTPIMERGRKVQIMKRQGLGLRVKFTLFFLILVLTVVMLIALPLSNYSLTNQRTVLAQGLQERLTVLMDSLLANARSFLEEPENYTIELAVLPLQARDFAEVKHVTITAKGIGDSEEYDTIWATSDTSQTGDDFLVGRTVLKDSLSERFAELRATFDAAARERLGTIPADLDQYRQRLQALALNTTSEAAVERQQIDTIRQKLNLDLTNVLSELSQTNAGSLPTFDATRFDDSVLNYVFYKPIAFRLGTESPDQARYYRGMVRLGVTTEPIIMKIRQTQDEIVRSILLFSLLAMAGGLVGAIILSSITVNPIKRLVADVEKIKDIIGRNIDTQISEFGKMEIVLKTGDELQTLGSTINDMVHGLHKAAEANKDLYAGKEIQKMFIPLHKVGNEKGTTGDTKTDLVEIFGYYEGAKGVSGDYFSYQKISKDIFAFIKCDVAGKGIPAALIMVEVATLFLSHFDDWEMKAKDLKKSGGWGLAHLVKTINDLIAEREFTERFAALNIVVLNERTGECVMCNAGDNVLYIYRNESKSVVRNQLTVAPAAGRFSSREFPSIAFKEDKLRLEFGDIMLLYTDGLEESQRKFRDTAFNTVSLTQEDIDAGTAGEDLQPGSTFEEMGQARLSKVIEAVQKRGVFTLLKTKNPILDEELVFDFSQLSGTAHETVMALIAVEKVFRLIPNPDAGPGDRILIDKKVDDFLRLHFNQYHRYFRYERTEVSHNLYREYTHMMEESQYDDLTVLAVRKQ